MKMNIGLIIILISFVLVSCGGGGSQVSNEQVSDASVSPNVIVRDRNDITDVYFSNRNPD